ncbi:MAG: glycerophosphodiester phosphodiesterase [Halieaceae bacterium]
MKCHQLLCLLWAGMATMASADVLVIAHRGASAYLPEHTLPAAAMAHAMGADYIEQDVVLSADDVPIVLHDLTLDATTDVARRFPGRGRDDGHFYAIDFSLAEIKTLSVGERVDGSGNARRADRFPADEKFLQLPTLAEEIELIQGLNRSTGRDVGIYVELKNSAFHAAAGKELPAAVLQVLYAYGYRNAGHKVYLQSFEPATLRLLKDHTSIRLVQLLEDKQLTEARVKEIASYAQGVGPWIGFLADAPEFVVAAQAAKLEVHPFTFRADQLPRGVASYTQLLDYFVRELKVDGLFTDQPDITRRYLDRLR